MIYLTCTLVITTLSMVLTVLVLNIYGTADHPVPVWNHPVPVWMRDFVLIFIARALGMCDTARTYKEAKDVAAAAARTERHRARLRDNGAGLNFFVRTALVGRGRQQSGDADDDDAGSSTFFEMTEMSERPGRTGGGRTSNSSSGLGGPALPGKSEGTWGVTELSGT